MSKPTPIERAEILEQFAAVDDSFRLDGFDKTVYSVAITEAVASGELTTEEAVTKILADNKQGNLRTSQ